MSATYSQKLFALVLCVLQNTFLVIMIRYSKTREGERYLTSSAVTIAEIVKVIVCFGIIGYTQFDSNFNLWKKNVREYCADLFLKDSWKVAVPAGLYAIQNNLLYFALSNLDPAPYQVSNQGKIFTTAILSVIMLQRSISPRKWGSIFLLFVGISLVQLESLNNGPTPMPHEQNVALGAISVITACFTSAFAGVYFEKILKGSNVTIWIRNIQMGTFGAVFAFILALLNDHEAIAEKGFFFAYNANVWIVILLQAVGGLIIAMVISYTNNIIKGFASASSIILSSIISVFLFGYQISLMFVAGAGLVIFSVYLYNEAPPPKENKIDV
eukprot:TRINITY_DN6264_c0_g1_i1.p1 TRINITY_DN6264_c0_g1~~TRINITY_DN6264_c0_g1_i1.p1  ORF type:complete len:327 (-),score=62.27 TRINITY_DN6264_c0_g1_i1:10-990(-)